MPAILVMLMAIILVSCAQNPVAQRSEQQVPQKTIAVVLEEVSSSLLSISGVVGAGEGVCGNKACIRVYVLQESPELLRLIPETIDGYPVVIEQTGQIHTLPERGEQAP